MPLDSHHRYDHLTDAELLRIAAFETNPLLVAVAERLEIRNRQLEDTNEHQARHYDPQQTEFDFGR